MPEDSAIATFRASLQSLVHELHFKSRHYPGSERPSPRDLHDADNRRFESLSASELLSNGDPFTALLESRASRILGADHDALVEVWQRAESTLNARMRAILGLLGAPLPRPVATLLVGDGVLLPPLHVSPGRNPIGGKRSDKLFGQPDIVMIGDTTAITIEMKVRGGKARACYDAQQHFKYLRLAEALHQKFGITRVHHVLLAPLDGRIVKQADRWVKGPVSHDTVLDLDVKGMLPLLTEGQQKTVQAHGGQKWLHALIELMPSRGVGLGAFLDVINTREMLEVKLRAVGEQQVSALRTYGLRPPSRRRPLSAT